MKPTIFLRGIVSAFLALAASALAAPLDTAQIENASGLKGTLNEAEGVFKVTAPRNDVKVSVDGWQMPPFMGLTSWAAFTEGKKAPAMVMGDLVLLQDEVNPVMSAALDAGLEVTALHNHFFHAEPQVYFMHISGEGTVEKLASGAALMAFCSGMPPPKDFAGCGFAARISFIFASAAFTPPASFSTAPSPAMCMK